MIEERGQPQVGPKVEEVVVVEEVESEEEGSEAEMAANQVAQAGAEERSNRAHGLLYGSAGGEYLTYYSASTRGRQQF
ncbi:unnamed protein product [Linum trigynum]|uniref:Uncharacterized protein n=1 Tax=Linum trigynum TaxID=586398 RepID=A0AAV2E6Z3_9ROSI